MSLILEKHILPLLKWINHVSHFSMLSNNNFSGSCIYLVGLNERLGSGRHVATVPVEKWVYAAAHGGGIPVLNDPRASSNPTTCEESRIIEQVTNTPKTTVPPHLETSLHFDTHLASAQTYQPIHQESRVLFLLAENGSLERNQSLFLESFVE